MQTTMAWDFARFSLHHPLPVPNDAKIVGAMKTRSTNLSGYFVSQLSFINKIEIKPRIVSRRQLRRNKYDYTKRQMSWSSYCNVVGKLLLWSRHIHEKKSWPNLKRFSYTLWFYFSRICFFSKGILFYTPPSNCNAIVPKLAEMWNTISCCQVNHSSGAAKGAGDLEANTQHLLPLFSNSTTNKQITMRMLLKLSRYA